MKPILVLAFAAGLFLGACSRAEPPAPGQTPIRFATDWRAEAEQGGFYEALANGEYAKRGLDVTIIQGGPGVNVPQLLAAGAVDMGIGSNSFIVMNLAAQKAPVQAVAAFMQKDPQVLIAHPDAGIRSIADMKGHPILLSDASVDRLLGLAEGQVRLHRRPGAQIHLQQRPVPGRQARWSQQGYVTSEPYTIEKEAPVKPKVFLLADDGYPGYATMVLAPDNLIATNPAAVKAFVEATAAGWQDYLHGDPDARRRPDPQGQSGDDPGRARPGARQDAGLRHRRFGGRGQRGGIGAMTDARWADILRRSPRRQGVYPKTLDYQARLHPAVRPAAGAKTP